MPIKIKKTKKSKKKRGTTTYHGARKKWKGSGHHGGVGMAGTGKRADHKKSLIIKLYGNKYFGKQGITSKKTERRKLKQINLGDIEKNKDSLIKKHGKENEINLKDYKVLGDGEFNISITIIAKGFSENAKEKIEKAGGNAIVFKEKKEIKDLKINKNNEEVLQEKKTTKHSIKEKAKEISVKVKDKTSKGKKK